MLANLFLLLLLSQFRQSSEKKGRICVWQLNWFLCATQLLKSHHSLDWLYGKMACTFLPTPPGFTRKSYCWLYARKNWEVKWQWQPEQFAQRSDAFLMECREIHVCCQSSLPATQETRIDPFSSGFSEYKYWFIVV